MSSFSARAGGGYISRMTPVRGGGSGQDTQTASSFPGVFDRGSSIFHMPVGMVSTLDPSFSLVSPLLRPNSAQSKQIAAKFGRPRQLAVRAVVAHPHHQFHNSNPQYDVRGVCRFAAKQLENKLQTALEQRGRMPQENNSVFRRSSFESDQCSAFRSAFLALVGR